ncbi:MAG: transcription termination/antitermination protein NusG [Candidatus Brocadiia bacterium]
MAKKWFVLRVQSNREEYVRDNLARAVAREEKDDEIPNILVPTQTVTEIRGGKRKQIQRKLYPGYVLVEVDVDDEGNIPDSLWYLIRETSGVGDFIGGEEPWPMREEEVARLLGEEEEEEEEGPVLEIDFKEGDMVEITEGPFNDMKGQIEEINPATGRVKVVISVFNRQTPVELDYWQVESA